MYNYAEAVRLDILDYIEQNVEEDITTLSAEDISKLEIAMEESMHVGGITYGHYNVDDEKAAEYISGNASLLNTVLHWAKGMGKTIEDAIDIDVLCRCFFIPTVLRHIIEDAKNEKAKEVQKPKEVYMNAQQRATWTKLFCDITLFNDWDYTEDGDTFDKDLKAFLSGDEATIKSCFDFIEQMLETFDEESTDHIRLERLRRKLEAFSDFIA